MSDKGDIHRLHKIEALVNKHTDAILDARAEVREIGLRLQSSGYKVETRQDSQTGKVRIDVFKLVRPEPDIEGEGLDEDIES